MAGQEKAIMTKKEKRSLFRGFLAVLILACVYAGILVWQHQARVRTVRNEEQEADQKIALSLSPDQIDRISFGKETYVSLEKNGDAYGSPEDPAFTASPKRMAQMEKDLSNLEISRRLTDAGDLSKYGLDDPNLVIQVLLKDGSEHQIRVGNHSDSEKALYIQVDEDSDVCLTRIALDEHFAGDLNALAKYEDFPEIKAEKIRVIEVLKESDSFRLDTPGDSSCTVTDESGAEQRADVGLAGTVQMNLSNLSWLKNVEYHCTEPEKYGLKEPAAVIRIGIASGENQGESGEASLSETDLVIGDQDGSGNYYVCLQGSSQVHSIRGEYLNDLVKGKASDFWSRSYSFVSISDLDRLEVSLDGEMHTLRAVSAQGSYTDDDMSWYVDDTAVTKNEFTDFYYACVSVSAQQRLAEVPEYKETPALSLHYYLKDGTEKQLDYYEEDQNFYTVVYENGSKAASTNRIYVSAMIEKGRELFKAASGRVEHNK